MEKSNIDTARTQMKDIINHIIDSEKYLCWDYTNNVLSCKEILGEYDLWLWFGNIRLVPRKNRYDSMKAGDLKVLTEWKVNKDNTLTLKGEMEDDSK